MALVADIMEDAYNSNVELFRETEYPMLKDSVYLDHAGSALSSKSLIESFTADMMANLYGNPHSASPSSQLSTARIEDTRLKVLQFFNADPEEYDIVFVANATAGIKLVMEAFGGHDKGFSYGYHSDSHTSIIGMREAARSSRCLDDEDVERWLSGYEALTESASNPTLDLFAYPAQSNLNGRRLPLSWLRKARELNSSGHKATYTLLDASALASTARLDLSSGGITPDFVVLSFYKIFGFPDLGALIVRKESGSVFKARKYFGGGTVDIVLCKKEQWHSPKTQSLHESLEDGTLQFHSILALSAALDTHEKLYGSMDAIAKHTAFLAQRLFDGLNSLRHANCKPVCLLHSSGNFLESASTQGPIVAFNLRNRHGAWVSNTEFEKLAAVRKFHIRSGGLCNPGGVAACLDLEPWEMRNNFSAGFRCGAENDIYAGKVTGVLRASVGATSTKCDIDAFVSFVREFYCERLLVPDPITPPNSQSLGHLFVGSLTIYPIKSCGGLGIMPDIDWEIKPEGLAWDREWCLVHQGTGQALNQKRHPKMALIRPWLDFKAGLLHVQYTGEMPHGIAEKISVPLSANPNFFSALGVTKSLSSRVCGDPILTYTYAKTEINQFFSSILGVPCVLARFPSGGSGLGMRHAKAHLQKHQRAKKPDVQNPPIESSSLPTPPDSDTEVQRHPILLSNESPILAINQASLDRLNKEIEKSGGKPANAAVFRANIQFNYHGQEQEPYCEDDWSTIFIGQQRFKMLGSCRRCHMICVDQNTAEKNEEPFITLAKTRRFESKIFFGSHMCHMPTKGLTKEIQYPTIRVGDIVRVGLDDA